MATCVLWCGPQLPGDPCTQLPSSKVLVVIFVSGLMYQLPLRTDATELLQLCFKATKCVPAAAAVGTDLSLSLMPTACNASFLRAEVALAQTVIPASAKGSPSSSRVRWAVQSWGQSSRHSGVFTFLLSPLF